MAQDVPEKELLDLAMDTGAMTAASAAAPRATALTERGELRGMMWKRSKFLKRWRRRYLVLDLRNGLLRSYPSREDAEELARPVLAHMARERVAKL